MIHRTARSSLLVLVVFSLLVRNVVGQEMVEIKGVVYDLDKEKGIEDIQIDVLIPGQKEVPQATTDGDGVYTLKNVPPSVRLKIEFYDPRHKSHARSQYECVSFGHLGARRNLHILNVVLEEDAKVKVSSQESRERLRNLRGAVERYKPNDRAWAAAYVEQALKRHQGDPTARFGEELSSLLVAIQPPEQKLVFTAKVMARPKLGTIAYCSLPERLEKPTKLRTFPLDLNPTNFELNSKTLISGLIEGLAGVQQSQIGGRSVSAFKWKINNNDQVTELPRELGGIASLSTQQERNFAIVGGSEGAAMLIPGNKIADQRTMSVGPTPVVVTVVADSGKLFSAVTVDGSYGVWDTASGRKVRSGHLGKMFPNSASFSSDGSLLVVGTGLATIDCSIAVVSLLDNQKPPTIIPSEAPVTNVEHLKSTDKFLTGSLDNSATIWAVTGKGANAGLRRLSSLEGVNALGVMFDGSGVGVWNDDQEDPTLFPVQSFINPEFNKEPYGLRIKN